jgi:hypothetical protein
MLHQMLSARKAKSEALKMRLTTLSDAPVEHSHSAVSFNHNLSNERINYLLSTLFKKSSTDAIVSFEEPNIPSGIPLSRLKEKSATVSS